MCQAAMAAPSARVDTVKVWHSVGRKPGDTTTFCVHSLQGCRSTTYLLFPLLHNSRFPIADTVLVDSLGGFADWYFTSAHERVRCASVATPLRRVYQGGCTSGHRWHRLETSEAASYHQPCSEAHAGQGGCSKVQCCGHPPAV